MAELTAEEKKKLREVHLGIQKKEMPSDIGSQEERMKLSYNAQQYVPVAPVPDEGEPKIFTQQRALLKGKGADVGSEGTTQTRAAPATGLTDRGGFSAKQLKTAISAPGSNSAYEAPLEDRRPGLLKAAEHTLARRDKGMALLDSSPTIDTPLTKRYKQNAVGGGDIVGAGGNILETDSRGPSFPDSGFGSPNVKDPVTGRMMQKAGYYNEAGTFIEGPRINAWDVGGMVAHSGARTPKERLAAFDKYTGLVGKLDEETGLGHGEKRSLTERVEKAKLASAERIANIAAAAGVQEAGIRGPLNVPGESAGSSVPFGYTKVTNPETGEDEIITIDKRTGQVIKPGEGQYETYLQEYNSLGSDKERSDWLRKQKRDVAEYIQKNSSFR